MTTSGAANGESAHDGRREAILAIDTATCSGP